MPRKGEIGRIGQNRYSGILMEEFLPELQGIKGVEVYREMSDNDETVGAILFVIEMLMRQCTFSVEPGGKTEKDKEAAEFVESCMNDMQLSWTDTISEIVSFLTYGWSYHEIVYKRRMGKTKDRRTSSKFDDGLIGWRKLPLRSQDTLWEWVFESDSDDLIGMTQSPPPDYGHYTIPIEKALHFRTKSRKDNPEGRSILRSAYRSWYFKKRIQEIEGIGMERDLAGFPVLYGPEGMDLWDTDDEDMVAVLTSAQNIVTNIRRDQREGLVMPNGWKLELLSAGNRRQFDTNQIIERYDKRIATTVIADFVLLGQTGVGSYALSSDKTRLFALAIGTYLDIICEVFNTQGIPRLIDINGDKFKGITEYPKMVHGDIEDANLEKLGAFISQMVTAGILIPDEALEDFVRRAGNLPERDENATYSPEERMEMVNQNKGKDDTENAPKKPKNDPEEPKVDVDDEDEEDEEQARVAKTLLGRL
ncbi:MAG: hypothetical protein IKW37_01440 [Bacteroidaceae bacterium]|nr:hypothetical protein [Bacteroidaceae bacterium]